MRVYQTYINMMNQHIRSAHSAGTNPWEFTHVQNLDFGKGGATAISNFDDSRPMVVMASPGMMQVASRLTEGAQYLLSVPLSCLPPPAQHRCFRSTHGKN